jgi:hypothetical protein
MCDQAGQHSDKPFPFGSKGPVPESSRADLSSARILFAKLRPGIKGIRLKGNARKEPTRNQEPGLRGDRSPGYIIFFSA